MVSSSAASSAPNVESQVHEVKSALAKSLAESQTDWDRVLSLLRRLDDLPLSRGVLAATKVGHLVNRLRKEGSAEVNSQASQLILGWKKQFSSASTSQTRSKPPTKAPPATANPNPNSSCAPSATDEAASAPDPTSRKASVPSPIDLHAPKRTSESSSVEIMTPRSWRQSEAYKLVQARIDASSPRRVKVRDKLLWALCSTWTADKERLISLDQLLYASALACEIESAMLEAFGHEGSPPYVAKYREISYNLSDVSNHELNTRVFSGEIVPARLAFMSNAEMASRELKEQRRKNEEWNAEASRSDNKVLQNQTEEFRCGRCGKRNCSYREMQTRSADEPISIYVTCLTCGNLWRAQ